MEGLAPPLKMVLELRLDMENGHSVREALYRFLKQSPANKFKSFLEFWTAVREKNGVKGLQEHPGWTSWRQVVLEVIERGLQGNPILEELKQLELDLIAASESQVEYELRALPIVSLIPVLLFQFPAYLLLLLGPWVQQLLGNLQ